MNTSGQEKQKQTVWKWVIVVLCSAAVIAVGAAAYMQFFGQKNVDVNSFATCRQAGGRIAETSPEQCVIDGKSFTNEEAVQDDDATTPDEATKTKPMTDAEIRDAYVGLSEDEAVARAQREDRQARVVARDDEQINSTTDLVDGRLNFTVKDGKVTAVEVERVEISQ